MIKPRLLMLFVSMVAVMLLSIVGVSAQDATPAASPAAGGMVHPAHIHEGTCEELDPNPLIPLENVMQIEDSMVAHSMTTIEVNTETILSAPHAINVHESPETADVYVACGNLDAPVVDGQMIVGLSEQNDSGVTGIAVIQDNDAGGADVHVYVGYGLAG